MKSIITTLLIFNLGLAFASNDKTFYQDAIQKISNQKVTVDAVNDTPVKGIKEVIVAGEMTKEVIYLSEDAEYLFEGKLMSLKNKKNLTEATQKSLRHELLTDFKKTHKSIDFLPEKMTEHITVFTDIDCGYCRKLHQEVAQYNALGIGVSYLFFPRAGLNTASHQKAVNVWCASDQQLAMTQAKNGQTLAPLMCPNPIESQYTLGIGAGVHKVGTPAVVFDDGTMIPGFLPAAAMQQRIELVHSQE